MGKVSFGFKIQAYLGDIVSPIPDHHSKMSCDLFCWWRALPSKCSACDVSYSEAQQNEVPCAQSFAQTQGLTFLRLHFYSAPDGALRNT